MSKEIEDKQLDSEELEKAVSEVLEELSPKKKEEEEVEKSEDVSKDSEKVVEKAEDKKAEPKKKPQVKVEIENEDDDDEEDEEKEMKSKKKEMKKKSLSDEEYQEYLELKKSKEAEAEELAKSERFNELKKAVSEETSEKFEKLGDIMKSFMDKIDEVDSRLEELGSQPARERKSVKDAVTVEKSFSNEDALEEKQETQLSKSKVSEVLEELHKSGKVSDYDVTLFELDGTLSPSAKAAIKNI